MPLPESFLDSWAAQDIWREFSKNNEFNPNDPNGEKKANPFYKNKLTIKNALKS